MIRKAIILSTSQNNRKQKHASCSRDFIEMMVREIAWRSCYLSAVIYWFQSNDKMDTFESSKARKQWNSCRSFSSPHSPFSWKKSPYHSGFYCKNVGMTNGVELPFWQWLHCVRLRTFRHNYKPNHYNCKSKKKHKIWCRWEVSYEKKTSVLPFFAKSEKKLGN